MNVNVRSYALDPIIGRVDEATITVEVARGLPLFEINGIREAQARESRERIRAALTNSGYEYPLTRINVTVSPAIDNYASSLVDLPIAAGILAATGQLDEEVLTWPMYGELALTGNVRSTAAMPLLVALGAKQAMRPALICPSSDLPRVRTVGCGAKAFGVGGLRHLQSIPTSREEVDRVPHASATTVRGTENDFGPQEVPDYLGADTIEQLIDTRIDRILLVDPSPSTPWSISRHLLTVLGEPTMPHDRLKDEVLLNRLWPALLPDWRFEAQRPLRRLMDEAHPGRAERVIRHSGEGVVVVPAIDRERPSIRKAMAAAIDRSTDVRLITAVSAAVSERAIAGDKDALEDIAAIADDLELGPNQIAAPVAIDLTQTRLGQLTAA